MERNFKKFCLGIYKVKKKFISVRGKCYINYI